MINRAWQIAPDAALLYAGDAPWWRSAFGREAVARFPGLKVTHDAGVAAGLGLCHMPLAIDPATRWHDVHDFVLDAYEIGNGEHSGFQAANVILHTGCRSIRLLGFDLHRQAGNHFHADYAAPLGNPADHSVSRWAMHWRRNAVRLAAIGAEIINCTPGSALECFTAETL